jgi:hypothetical protein
MVVALRMDEQLSRNRSHIVVRMFAAKESQLHDIIRRTGTRTKMVLTLRAASILCYHGADKKYNGDSSGIDFKGAEGATDPCCKSSERAIPESVSKHLGYNSRLKFDLPVLVFLVARGPTKRGIRSGSERGCSSAAKTTSIFIPPAVLH